MNEYEGLIEEGNEYEGLIDEQDAAQSTAVRASMTASKGKTPDQQAEIIDLASRSKIPADVVGRNMDEVRAKVEANEYDTIIQNDPELAGWLSSPENAAIGKDDVGSLSKISGALRGFAKASPIVGPVARALDTDQGKGLTESLSRTGDTITKSLLTDPLIELTDIHARPRKSIGGVTDTGFTDPRTGEFIDQGFPDSRRYFQAPPSLGKELNTIARGLNEALKADAEVSGETLPASVKQQRQAPGVNTAKVLDNLGQIPAYAIALFAPGKAAERTLAGVKALTQAERAAIAGAAANSAVIGSQTYNDAYTAAYDMYIGRGMHPEEAAYKAQYQAQKAAKTMRAIAAVTGALGEGAALTTASLKQIPKVAAVNVATEVSEELSNSAIVKAAAGEKLTADEAIEIAAISAILGGGVSSTMAGANVAMERQRSRSTDSVKAQQAIDNIATAAQESKLLPRSPEKFKEAVREMGQKSGQEAVYIPVDALSTYYQSQGIDPGAEIARLTGNAQAFQEAQETGADIKIPIENFAAIIAPTHYEGLKQHIRTEPDAMTPAESVEFDANQEEIAAGLVDIEEGVDTSPQVYESVLQQLVDAGIETKAAEKQAKLYSSVFRSLGQRTGLDPVTLYNRYGLTVSRKDMPTVERRKVDEKRQIIDKLPPDQRAALLKSDVIPALKSKRAFEIHVEQNPDHRVMFFDADDFKVINDKLGEDETDVSILVPMGQLIEEVAQSLGIQAFHRSGDEFFATGATDEQLDNFAKILRERLKSATFIATLPDGSTQEFNGIGFSYGIDRDEKSARALSKKQKAERKASGERIGARDSSGVGGQPPAGNKVPDSDSKTSLNQGAPKGASSVSTNTKAFRDWFADSKVVDENGEPLVVYHGTVSEIEVFKKSKRPRGNAFDRDSSAGFFFAADPKQADYFAFIKGKEKAKAFASPEGSNIVPAFLSLQNPMEVDAGGEFKQPDKILAWADEAKKAGNDGLIVRNVYDAPIGGDPTIIYIAFRPSQIKSAIGNRGTFDPNDPNILNQPAFHGSPHKFDKFSLEAMGTGEGVQAYGWGLYFSGNRAVAEFYQQSVGSKGTVKIKSLPASFHDQFDVPDSDIKAEAARLMDLELLTPGTLKQYADDESFVGVLAKSILKGNITREKGNIYQVDVPDDNDLLDWDKKMKDQPEAVRQKLEEFDFGGDKVIAAWKKNGAWDHVSGETLYRRLSDGLTVGAAADGKHKQASLMLRAVGIPGLRYFDAGSRSVGKGSHNYVIWDENAVSVEAVNDEMQQARQLFQPPPPPFDGARGQISFNDERTQFSILLFKNADMSTLLHESGHFYLEVLGDLVRRGEASQQVKDDYQTALKWMGSDGPITRKQHEQFARGFEAYLMEGKAPSTELAGVFARFRAWLTQIYRTVKALDVELSDEIRQVFDRLVATEDEIAAAEREMDYRVVFGTNPVLAKVAREAREAAQTRLANQAMKEITRQQKAEWKENRKAVMADVAARVDRRPVYQVLAYLAKGTLPDGSPLPEGAEAAKLSKKALLARYPQDWITRNLFKKKVYTNDGGVDPESLAPVYGFPSGDAMVQAIAKAEPRETVIARETDAEMKRLYGDMMTDGTMRQKALDAVHNSKRDELMLAELRAIKRKQREVEPFLRQAKRDQAEARKEAEETILPTQKELRFIKASAEQLIGQKAVRDINPNLYRVAEAKAGRVAFEAAAKGDYEAAYTAKLQQIRNHALYRAATKAKADSESVLRFLKRFQKKSVRQKLGKVDRLEQVDMLLDRYDLRRQSNKVLDAEKAKRELLTQIQNGLLTAPKSFTDSLQGSGKVNYRDETIEALRGLRDLLTQIRTEAYNEFEMMVNDEKIRLNEVADEIADTTLTTQKSVIPTYGDLSAEERMKEFKDSLINAWLRTPSLARLLDNAQRGAWTRHIIEPIRRAVIDKLEPMKDKAQKDLAKLYSDHYSKKEMVLNNERSVIPGLNISMSRWDLISLALNWGNAENRAAVLESTVADRKPFTEAGVARAFQTLSKRDWDFVQATWAYVDSYWPQIKESQRRRRGIAPPKVEADPFTVRTADGETLTLPGGYYPLKYNGRLDAKSRQHEMDDAFEKMRVGTMSSSQTKHGHTQERVGSGGQPVQFSLNVLHSHINNVIMDIALGDAVIYVDKVLRKSQVRQALIDTGNLDALESFKLWLKDVATGEMAPRSAGEQAARFIRLGFAKSKIGFNLVTTALQITGLPQTMVVTGKENFAKGAIEYAKNPRQAIKQVLSQSAMMRARYELGAYNKEVQGVYEALGRKGAPASSASNPFVRNFIAAFNAIQIPPWLVHFAFMGMKYSQLQVDTVTWLAGYEKAKGQDLPHDEAVRFADGVLENAQTSGMWNDRAPIERGTLSANTRQSEYVKLLTTLGSYMIAKGNIAAERYKATNFKDIGQALGFAGDIMMLFTVEAILGAAIRGQLPDDDEDWWAWTALQTGASMLSTIPILREFPSAMKGFTTGGPLGAFVTDLAKATNQTTQGEIDLALIKAYSNVIGTMTGYPSAQINRMVDAYWRESEGQDVAPIEYVVGRRN
jgi:GGDEF domain-containing protein